MDLTKLLLKDFLVIVYENTEQPIIAKRFRTGSFEEVQYWIDKTVSPEQAYEVFQKLSV
jgi:hypothetical protein